MLNVAKGAKVMRDRVKSNIVLSGGDISDLLSVKYKMERRKKRQKNSSWSNSVISGEWSVMGDDKWHTHGCGCGDSFSKSSRRHYSTAYSHSYLLTRLITHKHPEYSSKTKEFLNDLLSIIWTTVLFLTERTSNVFAAIFVLPNRQHARLLP